MSDIKFYDLEQLCMSARDWTLDFRPLAESVRPQVVGRVIQRSFGDCLFGYANLSFTVEQNAGVPVDCFTFGIMSQSMNRLWWRGQDLHRDTILVMPPGSELHSISGPDFEVFTISITEEVVRSICDQAALPYPLERKRPESFRMHALELSRVRLQMRQLRDTKEYSEIKRRILIDYLVRAWLKAADRSTRLANYQRKRDLAIRRSLQIIHTMDKADLTLQELSRRVGASARTLQYAYQERFALSPAKFLKAKRLVAARDLLKNLPDADVNVGDIASAFGFLHLGHFAGDYRKLFGELPSDTLSKSKSRSV